MMKNYKCVNEAIEDFYRNNNLDPDGYLSNENDAYVQGKDYDSYIGSDIFPSKVNEWLQTFDLEDINIFLNLLGNYTYLTRREYRHKLSILSDEIADLINGLGLDFNDIVFITIPSPKNIKSGGDEIRSYFNSVNFCRDINNEQLVCLSDHMSPELFKDKHVIIFLDDLIGSGKTIISSILSFIDYLKINNFDISDYLFYFAGIIVNKSANSYILDTFKEMGLSINNINLNPPKKLLKGGVVFDGNEINHVKDIIQKYEKLIDSYQYKTSLKKYVMGFNECKLTISFYYNTPNNTLCNFWEYSDTHVPLFERRSQVRPSINDLKERKTNRRINAYLMRKYKNEAL